jgi:hypothetical protein
MNVSKIHVWKTTSGSADSDEWVIDIYDETGEYICKMFSKTKPAIKSE